MKHFWSNQNVWKWFTLDELRCSPVLTVVMLQGEIFRKKLQSSAGGLCGLSSPSRLLQTRAALFFQEVLYWSSQSITYPHFILNLAVPRHRPHPSKGWTSPLGQTSECVGGDVWKLRLHVSKRSLKKCIVFLGINLLSLKL